MGISQLLQALSKRYPLCRQKAEAAIYECDHLYIDMNTILHKTCYESKFLANIPEKLIFQSIFHYLDKLVSILKPTKRLYIVIDGVPPRAKMAFQRVKRTRFDLILEKVIEERPQLRRVDNMDNVMRSLAPGSEFMERMASHLRYFIHLKISTDVNWRQLDVIFSDDRVPGEGEYKIAQYIYQCKSEDHVSSSIRHCIYANDSDLLIIGLATHEHNVMVLDDVSYELSTGQSTSDLIENWYYFYVHVLREYLDLEFSQLRDAMSFPYHLDRIVCDFVLLTSLLHNDYLPGIIRNGKICVLERLISVYKRSLLKMTGYLSEDGRLDLPQMAVYFNELFPRVHNSRCESHSEHSDHDDHDSAIDISDTMSDLTVDSSGYIDTRSSIYESRHSIDSSDTEGRKRVVQQYLHGLQWIACNRFGQLSDWQWYYPYEFAPEPFDFTLVADVKLESLKRSRKPFSSLEHLLTVQKPKQIMGVPKAFHDLILGQEPAMASYYNHEFYRPSFGPWKLVATEMKSFLYVDYNLLKQAIKKRKHLLSGDEKKRYSKGTPICISYNGAAAICVDAPIPKIFPDIICSNTKECTYDITDKIQYTKVNSLSLENRFTIHSFQFSSKLMTYRAYVKGKNIQVSRMMIIPASTFTLTEAKRLLGNYVFVGWPHLRKRKVMYVVSEEGGYRLPCNDSKKKKNPTFEYHTKRDALDWISTIQKLKKAYHRQGILLPSRNNILVYVSNDESESNKPDIYPIELIIEEKHNSNARHGRIQQSFGDIGVILNKKNYGTIVHISKLHPMKSKGIVYRNINGEDTLSNVNSQNALEDYDAEDIAAMEQQQQQQQQPLEEYESATSIASRLNTSVNLINRLTSSIKLYNQDNEDIADIGLKLRMADDKTARIGYSHKDTTGWSYSSEATNIIYEYLHRFPKLIERLGKQLFGVRVRKERLLPDDNNNDELVRIIAWLNTLSCNKNDTCIKMMNTTQLHTKAISRIRSIQPLQKHKPIPIKFSTKTLLNIDCNDTRMRMRLQQFNLGDRVIVIKNNGLVPFGCYGTVIEYEAPLVKLFLDYSFAFAQPIDLSPQSLNRYKLQLDASDVLNITRPQLLYEPTASKPSGNTEDAQKQQATTTLRKITKIAMPNNFQFCFSN